MRTLAKQAKSSKQSEPPQPAITAPFALTSDGQVLINAAECKGRILEGRALFTGVLMSRKEAQLARKTVDDAVFGAAAKISGRMTARETGPEAGPKAQAAPRPETRRRRNEPDAPSGSGSVSS